MYFPCRGVLSGNRCVYVCVGSLDAGDCRGDNKLKTTTAGQWIPKVLTGTGQSSCRLKNSDKRIEFFFLVNLIVTTNEVKSFTYVTVW